MKKSTMKFMSMPTLALLALVGCGKDDHNDGDVAVTEPVVQQLDAVCEDPELKMRLEVAIKDAILGAAMDQMISLAPEQTLSVQNAFAQQLSHVRINTQNATNFADSCMVDVSITPNPADVVAAEVAFAKSGATLLQRTGQDQVELNNGTIIAKQVTYQMMNGDIVMYATNHNAIRLVADILVASADTLPESMPTSTAIRPQVIERQVEIVPTTRMDTHDTQTERTPATTNVVPKSVERQTVESQTDSSTNATKTKTVNTPERKTVRDVAATTVPEKRKSDDRSRPELTQSAPSRKEVPPTPPAPSVTDGESSITIVESNETY